MKINYSIKLLFIFTIVIIVVCHSNSKAQCPTSIISAANGKRITVTHSLTGITDIDISGSVTANNKTLTGSNQTVPDEANNFFDPCFDIGGECLLTITHDSGTDLCTYDDNGNLKTLPIELIFFDAFSMESSVELKWITATEVNNDYFTIEKSFDGINWKIIGLVNGAGYSNSNIEYNLVDNNPINGINYYRLKQTDFDGTYKYSDIISISRNTNHAIVPTIHVYPNPIKSKILNYSFVLPDNSSDYTLRITNILGTEVFKKTVLHQSDYTELVNSAVILENDLDSGFYLLYIETDQFKNSTKFIVY